MVQDIFYHSAYEFLNIFFFPYTGPCTDFTPWTTEEQKLLEQALKTYPVNTPERWEKIAEAVPGRTKKDCMRRYKVGGLRLCCHFNYNVVSVLTCITN